MRRPPQLLRCKRASYFSTCEFRTYVPPECQPGGRRTLEGQRPFLGTSARIPSATRGSKLQETSQQWLPRNAAQFALLAPIGIEFTPRQHLSATAKKSGIYEGLLASLISRTVRPVR